MNAEQKMSWANKFMIVLVVCGAGAVAVFVWAFWNIARIVWGL